MNEIHRPQECINANCVNMCSIAQYEGFKHWFGDNPIKCPSYKKGEPINVVAELEKIKAEIEKERDGMARARDYGRYYGLNISLKIIYEHISELKGENK